MHMILKDKGKISQDEIKEYLLQWDWEWFLTFNIGGESADDLVRRFGQKLGLSEKLQVACLGVVCFVPQKHIHLLALGYSRDGKTLLNCNIHKAERLWGSLANKTAKIESIYDHGAVGYIVDKNMPEGKYEMVMPYNTKRLKKSKTPRSF